MPRINIAPVGVGNCVSPLVQDLLYCDDCRTEKEYLESRNPKLGEFHPRGVKIVAAFKIDNSKGEKTFQKLYLHHHTAS